MANLVELKLDLFCRGLRVDKSLDLSISRGIAPSSEYIGHGTKRASLSEGKCFLLHHNGKAYVANVAVIEPFVRDSSYEFTVADGEGWIKKDGKFVIKATPTGTPSWYFEPDVLRIFQVHGNDVIATALSNICVYKQNGGGCKFCALEAGGKFVVKRPEEITAALRRIIEERELSAYWTTEGEKEYLQFQEVNINSGSLPEEAMFKLYLEAIKAIRKIGDLPISAQIVPIDKRKMMQLWEAGLNTVSFNMEIYDEKIRNEMMPEKAGRHPVEAYLKATGEAVEVFGENQVSSWLIAGLEPPESTIAGCRAICENGGIPHVAIFRPLIGSQLEGMAPPKTGDVIRIYRELKRLIKLYGLNPFKQRAGCVRCGGCSALREILEYD